MTFSWKDGTICIKSEQDRSLGSKKEPYEATSRRCREMRELFEAIKANANGQSFQSPSSLDPVLARDLQALLAVAPAKEVCWHADPDDDEDSWDNDATGEEHQYYYIDIRR